jgi:hypothetical protein
MDANEEKEGRETKKEAQGAKKEVPTREFVKGHGFFSRAVRAKQESGALAPEALP